MKIYQEKFQPVPAQPLNQNGGARLRRALTENTVGVQDNSPGQARLRERAALGKAIQNICRHLRSRAKRASYVRPNIQSAQSICSMGCSTSRQFMARRNESGFVATVQFIALLAIMMLLATANAMALYHLHREVRALEQQQIKRLNASETNSVAIGHFNVTITESK